MRSTRPLAVAPALVALVLALVSSGCADSRSAESSRSGSSVLSFSDVTASAGLGDFRHVNGGFGQAWAPEIVGGGGGFLDYDSDGRLDVLLVGGGNFREHDDVPVRALWLYRNEGNGTFTDRTREAGLYEVRTYGLGISAADYDNDGDEDFFLATLYENLLFRNDRGTFSEIGKASGIGDRQEWSTSVLFFDADRDGHLDLYVGNYVDWSPEKDILCEHEGVKVYCTPQEYEGIPGRFYHNDGDGSFTDRTEEAGFVPIPGKVFGVVELDFNSDGWSDLFVAEDTERDLLFENRRDGTFVERGILSGVAFDEHGRARAGMGADAGVVDSTGEVTLLVGNFSDESMGVYRHLGNGLFQERAAASKLAHPSNLTLTFGLFLFDVDLDGDLDALAANGHVQTHIERVDERVAFRQPTQLYLNRGDGQFEEITQQHEVLRRPLVGRGAAYADYDRDGDLDVLLIENDGGAHLLRNELRQGVEGPLGSGANVLRVLLEGVESNRDALGSRVVAVLDGLRMYRWIRTGSSYLSQSEKAAVFGLGEANRADSLLIFWPGGRVDRLGKVEANQEIHVVEGRGVTSRTPIGSPPSKAVAVK